MRTVRKLVHAQLYQAIAFVALGFLALFVFFDLVDELQSLGPRTALGYELKHALLAVLSKAPDHLYELLPIAVLIGSIYVMARMAQSSQFTILRTGGLSPGKALRLLLQTGWVFVLLTYLLGDHLAPWAQAQEMALRSIYRGEWSQGQTGAWLREKRDAEQRAVNVRAIDGQQRMRDIRIQSFDAHGHLRSTIQAGWGQAQSDGWLLHGVQHLQVSTSTDSKTSASLQKQQQDTLLWPTGLTSEMVSAALVNADRMNIHEIYIYIRHLQDNNQNTLALEIKLWRKIFYPLSCLVMLMLALPFAYLHFRSGQIAAHVFGGVMAGISFVLLNNVFGHIANLQQWSPWIASAAPSLIYTGIALTAFGWMVWRR